MECDLHMCNAELRILIRLFSLEEYRILNKKIDNVKLSTELILNMAYSLSKIIIIYDYLRYLDFLKKKFMLTSLGKMFFL